MVPIDSKNAPPKSSPPNSASPIGAWCSTERPRQHPSFRLLLPRSVHMLCAQLLEQATPQPQPSFFPPKSLSCRFRKAFSLLELGEESPGSSSSRENLRGAFLTSSPPELEKAGSTGFAEPNFFQILCQNVLFSAKCLLNFYQILT